MVHLQSHVIGDFRTSSRKVDICTLVICHFLENETVPVHIRIDIRIYAVPGVVNGILRKTDGCRRIPCKQSFIVGLHPGGTVNIFDTVDRLEKRRLHRHIDFRSCILCSLFSCNEHDPVRAPRAVDCRCRSILEYGEALDGFGRKTVQVGTGNLDVVKKDKRCRTPSKSPDTADIEFTHGPWFS